MTADNNTGLAWQRDGSCQILADPALLPEPRESHFSAEGWGAAVTGQAQGRGSALFISSPQGDWVLREYLRGGLPARISRRHYFWTGLARSRAAREFALLAELCAAGFAVPRPVAVAVWRRGLFYRAAILMQQIAGARSLADLLADDTWDAERQLPALLRLLRGFAVAGYWHADLNARNLLWGADQKWHLIDWDRGRAGVDIARCRANAQRLLRSLHKIAGQESWPAARWQGLREALEQETGDAGGPA